ncbi:MAG: AAA family ATPase, partial [Lachnospiraceae bacterium]|nr:AAA family ATPase [Lachnospiraceae bacterium]
MRALDKVIGYEGIKRELYRILDVLNNQEKYKALGVKTPKGVLLDGEPGIGKSLMANCFIEESGRNSYVIRKDKPDGEFVDYIRETFERAEENAPSIILLDDLDKFANEDVYHRDAEEYVTVQSCIDKVKGKEVFVIATSNKLHLLPNSLIRNGRFDKVYNMHFPKDEDAVKIISFYLEDKKVAGNIDVKEIARFCGGCSCADLETIVNEAGVYAGYENREEITQNDMKRACMRKIYCTPEIEDEVPESVLRRRAIHEAGHAVMAEILNPGSVNFASITAKNRGEGGLVSTHKPDGYYEIFENKEKDILITLAGKAATEIVFQETDIGSNSDMHKAFDIVRDILDSLTSYDFMSWCHGEETSQKIFDHLDSATGTEVSRYYHKAKKILIDNREFLEVVAAELLSKKTISYKEIAILR